MQGLQAIFPKKGGNLSPQTSRTRMGFTNGNLPAANAIRKVIKIPHGNGLRARRIVSKRKEYRSRNRTRRETRLRSRPWLDFGAAAPSRDRRLMSRTRRGPPCHSFATGKSRYSRQQVFRGNAVLGSASPNFASFMQLSLIGHQSTAEKSSEYFAQRSSQWSSRPTQRPFAPSPLAGH